MLCRGRLFFIALQMRADSLDVALFVSSLTVLIRFAGFQQHRFIADWAPTLSRVTAAEGTAERRHLQHPNLSR